MIINFYIQDNREAKGVWSKKFTEVTDDSNIDRTENGKKSATLTNSLTAVVQMNRFARQFDVQDQTKGFYSDFNDEIKEFLLG